MFNIISWATISSNRAVKNGVEILIKNKENQFDDFSKELYQLINIDYPKFYKMDNLSKLGFLTSELVFADVATPIDENTTIILFNKNSSLDVDIKFNETIANKNEFFPSPAIFVYTLPNIMIGEICIRRKITGENMVLITETFNAQEFIEVVENMMMASNVTTCLAGFVDYTKERHGSFLVFIEKNSERGKDRINFTTENIATIFQSI